MASSSRKFTRTIEDFVCGHCGREVKGNGYTNHCPSCLWSKHVDKNPGDRAESCGGLMKPIGAESEGGRQFVIQQCATCGFTRRNSIGPEDDFDAYIAVASKPTKR